MKSCLILGSGRSGTSLAAGVLAEAGYFMGRRHWSPTDANPKGFYEDRTVNAINERLLARVTPFTLPWHFGRLLPRRLGWLQRWLAVVPLDTEIRASPRTSRQIRRVTQRRPFCLKDPRFCYTLPAWRPYLGDAVFLCIFRDPAVTLASLRRELDSAPYLQGLELDDASLLRLWRASYLHVLERHSSSGHWLFSHYEQILSGDCIAAWNEALGISASNEFADTRLQRSVAGSQPIPQDVREVYERLSELAGYEAP